MALIYQPYSRWNSDIKSASIADVGANFTGILLYNGHDDAYFNLFEMFFNIVVCRDQLRGKNTYVVATLTAKTPGSC